MVEKWEKTQVQKCFRRLNLDFYYSLICSFIPEGHGGFAVCPRNTGCTAWVHWMGPQALQGTMDTHIHTLIYMLINTYFQRKHMPTWEEHATDLHADSNVSSGSNLRP